MLIHGFHNYGNTVLIIVSLGLRNKSVISKALLIVFYRALIPKPTTYYKMFYEVCYRAV